MLNHDVRATHDDLDEPVRSLLTAAAAPTELGPMPGEAEALAAFRAAQAAPRRSTLLIHLTSFKTAIAAALGTGVLLTAGVGAAAAGSLPGAAQDTASHLLAKVGVTVPGADDHSAGNADGRGDSGDAKGADNSGHGAAVSNFARTTDLKGAEKGAAISELASDGKSHAGDDHGKAGDDHGKAGEDHGKAGEDHGKAGDDHGKAEQSGSTRDHADQSGTHPTAPTGTHDKSPVTTPNDGGTDTADSASSKSGDTASTHGTGTAGDKSSGSSAGGSANRP